MSFLVGLKESINVPTGIIWFSSSVVTLLFVIFGIDDIYAQYVEGDCFATEIIRLNFILEGLSESFLQTGALTIVFSAFLFYSLEIYHSYRFNRLDTNFNTVRIFNTLQEFNYFRVIIIFFVLAN